MSRRFDHVDLRERNLAEARPFYEALLPALGFTRRASSPSCCPYEAEDSQGRTEFFGVTESASHVANECRIAFWTERVEDIDRLTKIAVQACTHNVEGPMVYEDENYYAVFFEDPSGNRLEICCRKALT